MPPWINISTAIKHVSTAVLLLAMALMVIMATAVTAILLKDGEVITGKVFTSNAGTNFVSLSIVLDSTYLYESRTVSSTVQLVGCTVDVIVGLTNFSNAPDTLVTSQYMKWENTIHMTAGIKLRTLPPNSYTHSVGARSPKYVASPPEMPDNHHYIFMMNEAQFYENVTIRVEDAKIHFNPLHAMYFATGLHTVIHVSGTTIQKVAENSNTDALLQYPVPRSGATGPIAISNESFLYFHNCECVGCSRAIIYSDQPISISRNSAMIFRHISNKNPARSQPFFKCDADITVDETSVFSLVDINTANEFKASIIPLFDIKSIQGKGVIMFSRVSMQKSGLTTLQPVNNDNFYVSAKAARSTGDEMTTAQLMEEKFNVNAANIMNWDGTDASGNCVQAGLAIPGRATYTKVDGNCTATCTDANMTALCTKPYDNPCLVPNCDMCYRMTRTKCLACALHTTATVGEDRCECLLPNCRVCPTQDKCTECETNYKPNKEGICTPCVISHCLECPWEDQCTACAEGYKPSPDGKQCLKCDMPKCQQCSDDDKCHSCELNHKPANDGKDCFKCVIDNCQECKEDGTCRTCDDGYKPTAEATQCFQCNMPNCQQCSADNTCHICEPDHKPANNGKDCYKCIVDKCLECKEDGTCRTCDDGHKPTDDGSQCYQCTIGNCNYCTSDGVCGQCAEEYKLTNKNKACFHCTMPHCTECSANDMCMQCAEGYKPSADRKSCLQCTAPNCALCGTNKDCQRCDGGHTLTKKGECISCDLAGCHRCDEGGVCAMCDGDHSVAADGSGCVPCSMGNCTYCSDDGKCAMCACGMVPTNDGLSCVACDVANCVHCDLPGDGHTCAECASGYELSDDGDVCKRVPVPPWVVFLIVAAVTVVIVVAGYVGMILYLRHQEKQLKMATDAVERRRNRQDNYCRHRTELFILDIGDIEGAASGVRDVHKEIYLKPEQDDGGVITK